MVLCPFCGAEEIDGADVCQQCHQPLDDLTDPQPSTDLERFLVRDKVYMLEPRKPVTVAAHTPVANVLRTLYDRRLGCVMVLEDEELVGIFSERDALLRLNTDYAALRHRPIAEFMTPSPETVESDASIAFALHKMDVGGYRHLPVTADGKLVGLISIRDIFRYITDRLPGVQQPPAAAGQGP
jgi:CBS domain-containing protein